MYADSADAAIASVEQNFFSALDQFSGVDEGQLLAIAGGAPPALSSCSYVRSSNCGSCCSGAIIWKK